MTLEEDVRDMIKYELKSAELMRDILSDYSQEEIEGTVASVVDNLMVNVEDERREQTIYIICLRMGESLNSPDMVRFAKERLERFADSQEG